MKNENMLFHTFTRTMAVTDTNFGHNTQPFAAERVAITIFIAIWMAVMQPMATVVYTDIGAWKLYDKEWLNVARNSIY